MDDPDDAVWTAASTPLREFLCDTVFSVDGILHICDEAGLIIPEATVTLPAPDLPLLGGGFVSALAVGDRQDELAQHYRRVVAAYAQAGRLRQLKPGSPPFWLRPAIIAGGEIVTQFAWYDRVGEAGSVLEALVEAPSEPDGEVWDDLDQGWRIRIVKSGASIFVLEWNWEDEDAVLSGFAFDALTLSAQASAALDRLGMLHRYLRTAIGRDYWG